MHSVLKGQETLPYKAQEFIINQLDWINKESDKNQGDPYWDLVKGLILQLKGMFRGYQKRIEIEGEKQAFPLKFENFYYLTNMGDLEDILPAFQPEDHLKGIGFHECSGIVTLLKNDLITAHNTHNM